MSLIITDIDVASVFSNNEDVIGIPTETVYGLAGNIYSEKAVNKIYEIKKRPLINPLIVHIKSLAYLDKVAVDVSESALKLAKTFWPGPLTLVLNKHHSVPDIVTAGKSTVAVRVPNHPVALSLLESVNFPLAAPSANPSGSISPTSAQHVAGYFKDKIKIILDGGVCKRGIESTIIGFNNNEAILYRLGSISVEEIETVAGKVKMVTKNETEPSRYTVASLLLKPMIVDSIPLLQTPPSKIIFISFLKYPATCSALVGLIHPKGFALGAASGKLTDSKRDNATG